MRHTLREAWSGLRRNLSMTLAVIVTMWVSLTLFGGGLLGAQQVELLKGRWYDKIEISVFLCVADSKGGNCDPGQGATDAQKNAIRLLPTNRVNHGDTPPKIIQVTSPNAMKTV